MKEMRFNIMRLLFVCLAFVCLAAKAQTVVLDGQTGDPVSYASVFDKTTGKYLGNTDGSGCIPGSAEEVQTLAVQHLNYEPLTIEKSTIADGKIMLTPLVHTVKEVTVDKGKHEYVRMKVYARQLLWMTDTLAKVTKAICHFYFKASKPSGTPKVTILSGKAVYDKNILKGKNSKMVRGVFNITPELVLKITGPKDLKILPEEGTKRLDLDKTGGNWGIEYARFDWKNKRCSIVEDSVCFLKPFTFPFTGLAFSRFFRTETYDIHYGAPKLSNLANVLFGARVTHKKSNTSVDIYNEAFVLDVDYASKEDYEKEKNAELGEFVEPTGFQPLNDNVLEAMKNMRTLTKEEKMEIAYGQQKPKK